MEGKVKQFLLFLGLVGTLAACQGLENRDASSSQSQVTTVTSQPITISRDLTGSLDFSDPSELETSLQNLRNRTVTPPDQGQNTVLFTHQGKFDKAYGYYIPAGTTILFKPDGSGSPQLVGVLSYEEFMGL